MQPEGTNRLSSSDLATLVVDALVVAGIVKEPDAERAILIVTEEIDARKAVRDY